MIPPDTHDTQLDKKPVSRKQKPRLFFTPEEDSALQQGIRKYGFGNWQKMLNACSERENSRCNE